MADGGKSDSGGTAGGSAPAGAAAAAGTAAAMADRLALGDYTGALELAQAILAADPGHGPAQAARKESETRLAEIFRGRLGSPDRIPVVVVSSDDVLWRNIDPSAAFLLSLADGTASVGDLIDICPLPPHVACRLLWNLVEQGVVELRPPSRGAR